MVRSLARKARRPREAQEKESSQDLRGVQNFHRRRRSRRDLRTEAVRAGFKAAYDRNDYQAIIDVAKKIPENVLQEDEKLLMYYDVALTRLGED